MQSSQHSWGHRGGEAEPGPLRLHPQSEPQSSLALAGELLLVETLFCLQLLEAFELAEAIMSCGFVDIINRCCK